MMRDGGEPRASAPTVGRFTQGEAEKLVERLQRGEGVGELPTLAESFALLAQLPPRVNEPPVDALPAHDAEEALSVLHHADEILEQVRHGATVTAGPAMPAAEAGLLAEARRLQVRARTAPVAQAAALEEAAFMLRGRAFTLAGEIAAATAEPPLPPVTDEPAPEGDE